MSSFSSGWLTSTAFADGERIRIVTPAKETTCRPRSRGRILLPGQSRWRCAVDDPDAGRYPFTHWLAWGLAAASGALGEGEAAPSEGRNDFGAPGYRGPCPPPGKPHRYVFRLYALDAELELRPRDRRLSFDEAVEGHVLATAELAATYSR